MVFFSINPFKVKKFLFSILRKTFLVKIMIFLIFIYFHFYFSKKYVLEFYNQTHLFNVFSFKKNENENSSSIAPHLLFNINLTKKLNE